MIYTIFMLWFREKTIPILRFVWNQSMSLNWDKLRSCQESRFFVKGQDKWVVTIEIHDIHALVLQKKNISIIRFVCNQSSPLKQDKLRSCHKSKLIFSRGKDKWVAPFEKHDIHALVSQKNYFYPSFCLKGKFIHKMSQTLFVARI